MTELTELKQKDMYVNISEPLEIFRRLVEWAKANPEAAILISKGLAEAVGKSPVKPFQNVRN